MRAFWAALQRAEHPKLKANPRVLSLRQVGGGLRGAVHAARMCRASPRHHRTSQDGSRVR